MKTKNVLRSLFIAVALQLGMLAASAQTNIYLYTGYETNITLAAGTYNITAYGAQGGGGNGNYNGGLGAEMSGKFNFSSSTNLTLLVGGVGGYAPYGGGAGGGSFVVKGSTPLVISGGGGGSGSSAGGGGSRGSTGTSGSAGSNGGNGVGGSGGSSGGGGGGGGLFVDGSDVGGGGGGGYGGSGGGYGGSSFSSGGGGGVSQSGGGSGGYGGGGGGGSFGGGGGGGYSGGGGGGSGIGGGGGGGGSIIDSSAITNLTEVSGIASPDDSTGNGEIIISTVSAPTPPALGISTYSNQPAVFFPTATGTNFVLQMTTNLANGPWVTVSNGVPISGIIISNPPPAAFFRLH